MVQFLVADWFVCTRDRRAKAHGTGLKIGNIDKG